MILVTGAAGFIGYHVADALLARGDEVVGIDNLNAYYDPELKNARLARLKKSSAFRFEQLDLCDYAGLNRLFDTHDIHRIVHLAAQAGVRYSLENPFDYQKSNNEGFLNIAELARHRRTVNLVYASSSSVYGGSTKLPFCEDDPVGNPVSLYAATKRSNELVAHCYHHLFGVKSSGLRFFTVYGPWGRPDMALFIFTKAILEGRSIDIYNCGKMRRNWTYVDDIVNGVLLTLDKPVECEVYNIGNSSAEGLMEFVEAIEQELGRTAEKKMLPMQPGDVPETVADIEKMRSLGYEPQVDLREGVKRFVAWYREYYSI